MHVLSSVLWILAAFCLHALHLCEMLWYFLNMTGYIHVRSIEEAASEVERKAMTVDGGGASAERLQRSIFELRRVSANIIMLMRSQRAFDAQDAP